MAYCSSVPARRGRGAAVAQGREATPCAVVYVRGEGVYGWGKGLVEEGRGDGVRPSSREASRAPPAPGRCANVCGRLVAPE
jgi:hypothetical protein